MRGSAPDSERARRMLRAYLLETLGPWKQRKVQRLLASSVEWRDALEEERATLARLDGLLDQEPRRDLTSMVMAQVRSSEVEKAPASALYRKAVFAVGIAVVVCVAGAVLLPSRRGTREAAHRASSQNYLKQWGIIFKMYANDHGGMFPPVTRYADVWFVDLERVYPEYLTDWGILVNPRAANSEELARRIRALAGKKPIPWDEMTRIAAESYTYTGWVMCNDEQAAQVRSGRERVARADPDQDIIGPAGETRRLREGVERFMITDINNAAASSMAQSRLPVMFENVYEIGRDPKLKGCNVLYMDGHVEYIEYGAEFPVTDAVAGAFRSPTP